MRYSKGTPRITSAGISFSSSTALVERSPVGNAIEYVCPSAIGGSTSRASAAGAASPPDASATAPAPRSELSGFVPASDSS